jgi:hypothetical protein
LAGSALVEKSNNLSLKECGYSDSRRCLSTLARIESIDPGSGKERDPLELYKIYLECRPEKAMNPDSPFYLTCIPWTQIDSGIWYFPRPMGRNTLGNIMPMATEECGMDRKTNHSVLIVW